MKRNIIKQIYLVLRIGLGCMFIWSALVKLRLPYEFLGRIYEYELVGPKMGLLGAMLIPWLELIVGIGLLSGILVGGNLLITIGLMAFFTFAHASVIHRGLAISCGCFNTGNEGMISYGSLLRNICILVAALIAFIGYIIQSKKIVTFPIQQAGGAVCAGSDVAAGDGR